MRTTPWQHFDFLLLGAVAVLTIFGIAMINSTIAGNIELTASNLPIRQLIFALIGFVLIFVVCSIDYHFWASISGTLYTITFVTLAVLYIMAATVFGSARWFTTALVNIQPSELAKIVLILTQADFFTRHKGQLTQFKWVLRSLLMALGLVVWVVIQPNLSTSILMMVIWAVLWWACGIELKHVGYFVLGLVLVVLISIPLLPSLKKAKIINDYQIRRITNFIQPPKAGEVGARYGDTYNIEQALISIGSGGWLGQGYGHGTQVQLRFLKVRWSDYIFAATAEEFGFVGATLVMLVLLMVIMRCLRVARLASDTYGALIAYGVATLIAFQAIVNIGVNLKQLPATGLPLPFISYGGSSLLSLLLGIGLVEAVLVRHKSLEF